jgi:hypothetical protein
MDRIADIAGALHDATAAEDCALLLEQLGSAFETMELVPRSA